MPGMAASTRETCSFGPAPKPTAAPENSLALEATWACTSRPSTISHGPVRPWISFDVASLMAALLSAPAPAEKPARAFACAGGEKMPSSGGFENHCYFRGEIIMRKTAAALAAFATLLAGPALAQPAPAAQPAAASGGLSVETTPINDIVKNEQAKAVLVKALPEIANYF